MKALILAGGFGTRLREVIGEEIPKPMASILGKPFLEHQIYFLREQGIKDIILAVHYKAEKIKSYFGNGSFFGVNISYSDEEIPLGTAGAIKNAEKYIDSTFLVLNGDGYSQINLTEFLEFHKRKNSRFTISLVSLEDASAYGGVVLDGDNIIEFCEKGISGKSLINCGVYIFEPEIFDYIPSGKNVSIEKEVFPKLAKNRLLAGYRYEGYFMDMGRPETYHQFKQDILNNLLLKENNRVREAMQKITRNGIDIILIVDENRRLLGVLNDKLIKKYILEGGGIDESVDKAMIRTNDIITAKINDPLERIHEILQSGINRLPILDDSGRIVDVRFKTEELKPEVFPVIRGRTPLRISLAGGGTDLPYFFEKFGGVVISSTIDKYCHATIIKRADSKVIINCDFCEELSFDLRNIVYDGKLDLIKAVVNLIKPHFGFEIYLHNDISPGRGLGSSASLAVLIASLISHLQNMKYDDSKIAEIAYKAEREELGIKGGWQDQYAAITGGFNFMEFGDYKTIIYPLRLKEEVINELNRHLLLCYVGSSHFSGNLHKKQESAFKIDEEETVKKLNKMKDIAIEIKDALLANNLEKIGELLHDSWEHKRKIDESISNPKVDILYETGLKNGAIGGKLLGAGGGGYLLFFHSPTKRNLLKKTLEGLGGEVMSFNFEDKGTRIWNVKK